MAKVLFSVQYDVLPEKKDEYLKVVKELKVLLNKEGIESYNVYEVKGKTNSFQEIYTFTSLEAYEAFDDNEDERLNLLINKLNDITTGASKYQTLIELSE